tara:strand:+ start:24984 stop:25475 length:492 start_codon:yes stop_codon:yes gene_type:complete
MGSVKVEVRDAEGDFHAVFVIVDVGAFKGEDDNVPSLNADDRSGLFHVVLESDGVADGEGLIFNSDLLHDRYIGRWVRKAEGFPEFSLRGVEDLLQVFGVKTDTASVGAKAKAHLPDAALDERLLHLALVVGFSGELFFGELLHDVLIGSWPWKVKGFWKFSV